MKEIVGAYEATLNVNGEKRTVVVFPEQTLLSVLRGSQLGLTGAKPGCENGDCGACTVLLDNVPVKSCMKLVVEVEDVVITTVEGLEDTEIQKQFLKNWAFQCGYCTSGFLMNAYGLLLNHPDADEDTITEWLRSNVCRCTGYGEIQAAVRSAAAAFQNQSI